jgi:hypothetical protein
MLFSYFAGLNVVLVLFVGFSSLLVARGSRCIPLPRAFVMAQEKRYPSYAQSIRRRCHALVPTSPLMQAQHGGAGRVCVPMAGQPDERNCLE